MRAHVVTAMMDSLLSPMGTITYPADWWQGFKERWFPRWLRHISPVQRKTHFIERLCPHASVMAPAPHGAFLAKWPSDDELIGKVE